MPKKSEREEFNPEKIFAKFFWHVYWGTFGYGLLYCMMTGIEKEKE